MIKIVADAKDRLEVEGETAFYDASTLDTLRMKLNKKQTAKKYLSECAYIENLFHLLFPKLKYFFRFLFLLDDFEKEGFDENEVSSDFELKLDLFHLVF